MLKVGIAGIRGALHAGGFPCFPGIEVAALCEMDESLLATQKEKLGIPHAYRVFDDMLEADVDAVVVATPMQCHVPQAIAALQAGKYVLSEVTAGVTMDELWCLIENVEQSGRVNMMAEDYC